MTTSNARRALVVATLTSSALLVTQPAQGQTAPAPAAPTLNASITTADRPLVSHEGNIEPQRGMIRAYMDDVSPFWDTTGKSAGVDVRNGALEPFWGKIEPYRGMIRAYEGDISPLAGMIRAQEGDLMGMRGMIRAFMGDLGAMAGMIRAQDSTGSAPNYAAAMADYRAFVAKSSQFWSVPVQKATGKSFNDGFAAPLLKKYGIDMNDPSSLSRLDANTREIFFLDWQDNLMQYSGADQVDHWMRSISWSPKLTQQQGSGSRAVIGLVDFFVAKDPDVASKVIYSGGYTDFTSHGAGVASLILASHDGRGVMGIAPNARVAAFNPFDATHTASWADVTRGIIEVGKAGANVINLSLGVPGHTLHPEWRNVLKNSEVDKLKATSLYVIAAGNSGTVQTANINMKDAFDSTFLVVGSVGADGAISSFSNQPGNACLTDGADCKNVQIAGVGNTGDRFIKSDYLKESGLLMNRFLVAPGELILVSDGQGGVTRMSGTSFAAPLVAGAIALIHDRWPWLKKYPRDVAKILLDSATDLGAPGADPVYGRGMLNVEAAQSVLDFNKLNYELWNGAKKTDVKLDVLRRGGFQSAWADNDMYFAAFEKIDSAERDFLIPLSSRLFGTMRNGQYFQEFVYNHFVNWLQTGVGFVSTGPRALGFSDVSSNQLLSGINGWSFGMTGRLVNETFSDGRFGRAQLRSSMTVQSPDTGFSFTVGSGDGALGIGNRMSLQTTSDFDALSGGVNPLLGFASGGAHIASTMTVAEGLQVSVGATSQRMSRARMLDGIRDQQDRLLIGRGERYGANAINIRVDYRANDWLGLSTSITRLQEEGAFLGIQSLVTDDFGDGTMTDGVTLQADAEVGDGFVLFGSATGARSTTPDREATFRLGGMGAFGTAFQLGVAKVGLFNAVDRLRLTLSQPLTIEQGTAEFTSVMVVDRETGEKGLVTQRFRIGAPERRRAIAEVMYGTPMLGNGATLTVFGRGELRNVGSTSVLAGAEAQVPSLMMGSKVRMPF